MESKSYQGIGVVSGPFELLRPSPRRGLPAPRRGAGLATNKGKAGP